MYIKESRCLTAWNHSANDLTYELMQARIGGVFIGATYPPHPVYTQQSVLCYIESYIDEIVQDYPGATIILADFNQLPQADIVECTVQA